MQMMDYYEARGIAIFDKEGRLKDDDILNREDQEKDLAERAEAGLRK